MAAARLPIVGPSPSMFQPVDPKWVVCMLLFATGRYGTMWSTFFPPDQGTKPLQLSLEHEVCSVSSYLICKGLPVIGSGLMCLLKRSFLSLYSVLDQTGKVTTMSRLLLSLPCHS